MKPIEMVEMIKQDNPELLGKLPEKRAAQIIREVFSELARQVDAVEEGTVKVPGFGTFVIKRVERVTGGEKVTVRRVVFRTAKVQGAEPAEA